MIKFKSMKLRGLFLLSALQLAAIVHPRPSGASDSNRSQMHVQGKIESEEASKDRRELISTAPRNFKPATQAQKIRFQLRLEKSVVKTGEPVRYQVELVNDGSEAYVFAEGGPSFFKSGLTSDRIRLILKEPGNKEINLRPPLPTGSSIGGAEIKFPAGLSDTQKEAWVESGRLHANAAAHLFAKLAPGEVLRTRGDGPDDKFRTLSTRYRFNDPGLYEIHLVYGGLDDPGVSSNPVRLTIIQ